MILPNGPTLAGAFARHIMPALMIGSSLIGCSSATPLSPDQVNALKVEDVFSGQSLKLAKAVEEGRHDDVKRMLDAGADPNTTGLFGVTVLMRAMKSHRKEVFQLLLDNKADSNCRHARGGSVIHDAAEDADPYWLSECLKHGGDPNLLDVGNPFTGDWPPIFGAIQGNRLANVKLLVESGADLHYQTGSKSNSKFPLYIAYSRFRYEIAHYLIVSGADPEQSRSEDEGGILRYMELNSDDSFGPEDCEWREKIRKLVKDRAQRKKS